MVRRSRTPKGRKAPRKSGSGKTTASPRPFRKTESEILELVRDGVEQFILKNATVDDFLRAIRAAGEKGNIYSHQLTRSVFAKIVRQAIKKRNLSRSA